MSGKTEHAGHTPGPCDWALDAHRLLLQYYDYCESLRKIGRGWQPIGILGHSASDVIKGFEQEIRENARLRADLEGV